MSQDTEKWPVFNQPASKQKARSQEEMSRMFKNDEEKLEGNRNISGIPYTFIFAIKSINTYTKPLPFLHVVHCVLLNT